MVKVIRLPATGGHDVDGLPPRVVRTAQDAALGYDHCIESYWRGESDGCTFCDAFAEYWRPVVERVEGPPQAISPLGAGGRGLAWRAASDKIVGVVQGGTAGYQIPVGAEMPLSLWEFDRSAAIANESLAKAC